MKLGTPFTAAMAGLVLMVSGCSSGDDTGGDDTIVYGAWVTGAPPVSNMWTNFLEQDEETQEKYGIDFQTKEYSNLQTLYNDLAQGRVDAVSAGPSTMAISAAQGAPLHLVGLTARSTAAILSSDDRGWSADELRGSRMVASTSTATWRLVESQIEEQLGLEAGSDYELVTAENISGAVSQLAAGTADYAMAWGEYIPSGLKQYENIDVVADPESLSGPSGRPFWQFSISTHEQVRAEQAEALVDASAEIIQWMQDNPDEVEEYATGEGQEEGIATEMIAGLQTFEPTTMNDELRSELEREFEVLSDLGAMSELPPESFYGKQD